MASSATDTTNSEVGHADGAAPFPPFQTETYPSQLLWLAITFGLFYYLMAKVALPRISSILEVRSDRIEQDLDEANRMQGESDAAIAAYEQSAAEAQANAQVIRQEATDAAKARADKKRVSEEAKLADLIAKSEAEIAATKSAAMKEVDSIAVDTTEALVNRLLDGKVPKAEIKAAVSQAQSQVQA